MMYLALSYDHRIIDGREAVTFLVRVKEAIEDPQRLLIGMYGGDGRGRSQRLRGPAPEAPSRPSWRGRLRARPHRPRPRPYHRPTRTHGCAPPLPRCRAQPRARNSV